MAAWVESDYADGIQAPSSVFRDPELRSGSPELISPSLPLPKARTGNFASVYKMVCGSRTWAVRCFTRPIHPDQEHRYSVISEHLRRANLSCAVGFKYLREGIRIGGEWRPILKMEWINGETLKEWVERNLGDPMALRELAKKWVRLLEDLRRAGIAHGDLQHGNVVLVGDEFRLIDYDGMYVPALRGYSSHEGGHSNYQHPRRGDYFGPELDNFSAWSILVSIVAVSFEPGLWGELRGGDECLLFRKADFVDPERSRAFQALLSAREPRLRAMASLFRTFLSMEPSKVPWIKAEDLPFGSSRATAARASSGLPDWIDVQAVRSPSGRVAQTNPQSVAASVSGRTPAVSPRIDLPPVCHNVCVTDRRN